MFLIAKTGAEARVYQNILKKADVTTINPLA
jgi:hypothetical protein